MGREKRWKQGAGLAALLLTLLLTGTGCGDGRQADPVHTSQSEDPAHAPQAGGTDTAVKTGVLDSGYFFEEDGILLRKEEYFLYSDWEPVEFDYICMDPTCSHGNESCSAGVVQDEESALMDFSLLYQDRLIILHACYQYVDNDTSKEVWDYSNVYQTEVYEADPDGSNRRKMATFPGSIGSNTVSHAAVLMGGKLYFGGPTEVRDIVDQDIQGEQAIKILTNYAVYCLDLNNYTVETFAVEENKEGGYQYQIYEYDGMIYAIISNCENSAVWYRLNPGTGVCEEILRFDTDVPMFEGAIGDTVYYWYLGSEKTFYARDIAAGAEEREIMEVTGGTMMVIPLIVDGQVLCMVDSRFGGEDSMAEYTVFDPDGNVLDTIRYDDYITFLDVVGDKILYYKLNSDFVWEIWWADKKDLTDLTEKGVRIGSFFKVDTPGDQDNID